MATGFPTLTDCLRTRAAATPDKQVFTFLDDTGEVDAILTYAELDRRARVVAERLRAHGPAHARILLLFEPGLDFIAALFGCLYAGSCAVPAYPPKPAGGERTLARLKTIVADATPVAVLTSRRILASAKPLFGFAADIAALPWLAVDELCLSDASPGFCDPERAPQDLAIIQYTSGSTSVPKGVMVSHSNILANMLMLGAVGYQDEAVRQAETLVVSWLPFFHDLGLMGGILLPVILGGSAVLMSPFGFLRRPSLWLSAISRYRAASTFVPNFALDIAARKITGAEREALDLSSLRVCVIGAEPVRHRSVERFIRCFGKQGLARSSMVPGYGLAEAVVGVTGGPLPEAPRSLFVDREALTRRRLQPAEPTHPNALAVISCGRPFSGGQLAIVDPDTRRRAAPGEIGEIWLHGPHVALGYWRRDADTEETFQARLADGSGQHWLRTGDLGILEAGHLYVTGRIKDLIIIRGRNHYPQDIEATVEECHPRILPGAVIAFAHEREGAERLVIVAEMNTRRLHDEAEKLETFNAAAAAIRMALGAEHQVQAHGIVFVGAGRIDKTSSGKLARQACKQRYLQQTLKTEFVWQFQASQAAAAVSAAPSQIPHAQPPLDRQSALVAHLAREIAVLAGRGNDLPSPCDSLEAAGLDSLATMELAGHIEQHFGLRLPAAALLGSTTIGEIVTLVERHQPQDVEAMGAIHAPTARPATRAMALRGWAMPAPLFCIGGAGGAVSYLAQFDAVLDPARPFIAFQAPGLDGGEPPLGSIEELARRYIDEIKAIQPAGPYALMGHSFGGLVAYEMAQLLAERGESMAPLILIDTTLAEYGGAAEESEAVMARYELGIMHRNFGEASAAESGQAANSAAAHALAVYQANYAAMERYQPRPYAGPVILFRARDGLPPHSAHPARRTRLHFGSAALGWDALCPALRVVEAAGDHFSLVLPPHAEPLAREIATALAGHPAMPVGLERLQPAGKPRSTRRVIETTASSACIDAYHPDFIADPYPFLHQMRGTAPVHRDSREQWWITRYADISAGLRDRRFSADPGRLKTVADTTGTATWYDHQQLAPLSRVYSNFMPFLDPPRHAQLRRLFTPALTLGGAQRWSRYIEERVDDLIADMRDQREPDIVRDLAQPLTVSVAAALLGFPPGDVAFLVPWGRDLAFGFDAVVAEADIRRVNRSAENFLRYLREQARRWRTAPAPQSSLHGPTVDGAAMLASGLAIEDLTAAYAMVFMAAFETTISMVGNSTLALWRNPDQRERLRRQPELAENAVEELLRYDGAVRCGLRCAREDVDIGGQRIAQGEMVLFMFSAANRDPAIFPAPDRLDIGRANAKQHVAFSHGAHYCLGAPLARLELQCVLRALVRQDFALAPAPAGFAWRRSAVFRTLDRLRIAWR